MHELYVYMHVYMLRVYVHVWELSFIHVTPHVHPVCVIVSAL